MTELEIETSEFFEQLNYGLSLAFREKWRHRFGSKLIDIFQESLIKALQKERPIKKDAFVSSIANKHHYNESVLWDFLEAIEVSLYRPIIV